MDRWVRDENGDLIGIRCDACSQVVFVLALCSLCVSERLVCQACMDRHRESDHGISQWEAAR